MAIFFIDYNKVLARLMSKLVYIVTKKFITTKQKKQIKLSFSDRFECTIISYFWQIIDCSTKVIDWIVRF